MKNEIINKTISALEDFSILNSKEIELVKTCLPTMQIEYNALNEEFCDEYILLDKEFPTNDSKYYQAVRELNNRLFRLIDAILMYQEIEIDIEKLSADNFSNIYDEKKAVLELQRKKLRLMAMQNEIRSLFQEISIWKGLLNKYYHSGLKAYGDARLEEMFEKKQMIQYMVEQYGFKLTESQIGLFLKKVGRK